MATASPRSMSRTSRPQASAATKMAGPMSVQGTVDWTRLFKEIAAHTPAKLMVMEHDNPSDAKRFASRSIDWVRGADGVRGMNKFLAFGIIGCGNISAAYLKLAPLFKGIEMRACADINPAAAKARADEFGVRAKPSRDCSRRPTSTIDRQFDGAGGALPGLRPGAGTRASMIYSEKPFVAHRRRRPRPRQKGRRARDLRVRFRPRSTFLGGAHQLARQPWRQKQGRRAALRRNLPMC